MLDTSTIFRHFIAQIAAFIGDAMNERVVIANNIYSRQCFYLYYYHAHFVCLLKYRIDLKVELHNSHS